MSGPGPLYTLAEALEKAVTDSRAGNLTHIEADIDCGAAMAAVIREAADAWAEEQRLCCGKIVVFPRRESAFAKLVQFVETGKAPA